MALQDYIPNIFGVTDPGVEGLLGADQSKSLQSRSNIAGLLGAAAALSQGMSRGGPRRSALQNILGAASGGFQSSQGAYQQGLQTVGQQQQLAQQMRDREQAMMTRQSIERVMQMPEVANNPTLVAQLRADPINTLKFINENMAISKAYEPMPAARPQIAPQQAMDSDPIGSAIQAAQGQQEQMLPPVAVNYAQSPLQIQKDRLLTANQRLTGLPGKTAQEAIKNNIEQIAALDKQLIQESAANFDFNALKNNVSPDLAPQVDNLQRLAESGQFSMQDLQKGLQDIQKVDFDLKTKQRDYTNEVTRVAAGMFPNKPLNTLSPNELVSLQTKLDSLDIAKRKAGATNISMYSKAPVADANGNMVYMPTKPGMPVLDLAGKPVTDFKSAASIKQLPPTVQKAEEEDYTTGTAAINLASDANRYLSAITQGQIKFGKLDRASILARSLLGSSDPDVVARNDFDRFKTALVNESLRLNKGTQTESDALRATKELESAESAADAGKAIQVLRDLNVRRANDSQNAIIRRRINGNFGEPQINLEVPKFDPYVFTDADYARIPKGSTYIDPMGQRKVKK